MAPGGLVVLWLSNMDVNATNFALEVENYTAIEKNTNIDDSLVSESYTFRQKTRFGTPYFYPFLNKNVVDIYVEYYNGESHSINTKNVNESILYHVNEKRGWGLAKSIPVTWFDDSEVGYKSTYYVDWSKLPFGKDYKALRNTNFVYLLDRENDMSSEWSTLVNKRVFQLTEIKREKMRK